MGVTKNAAAEWRSYWFLPIAAALGYATSVLHIYSLGPFIVALTAGLRLVSRAGLGGIDHRRSDQRGGLYSCRHAVDRIGPRRVGLIGVPALCGAFALASTATGEFANWLVLWIVIAVGTFGVQATVWTSAVASRFETSRGFAFAITLSGASIRRNRIPDLRDLVDRSIRMAHGHGGDGWDMGGGGVSDPAHLLSRRQG